MLHETAKAKLNLSLKVRGRRSDGFHELESLVAFAEFGDGLELTPGAEFELEVEGPFAGALTGDNLVMRATSAARRARPDLALGRFRLTKKVPVASGLGGGSADAAAALRLLSTANAGALGAEIMQAIAEELGSDVAVCLGSKPAIMRGRGERVTAVSGFPRCGVVLANPRVPLATRDVYAALQAPALAIVPPAPGALDLGGSFAGLLDYMAANGNDLEAPALQLAPEIGDVLDALSKLDGARAARLSGSGASCFALFETRAEAEDGAARLGQEKPAWWVIASELA